MISFGYDVKFQLFLQPTICFGSKCTLNVTKTALRIGMEVDLHSSKTCVFSKI